MFVINGVTWFLNFVQPRHPKLQRSDGSYALGACDNMTRTIYINNKLPQDMIKKVLCHEITHSAMFSYNIILTLDQEELLADLIATYGEEIIDVTNRIFSKIKNREGI